MYACYQAQENKQDMIILKHGKKCSSTQKPAKLAQFAMMVAANMAKELALYCICIILE
jgi:hypothetical protein